MVRIITLPVDNVCDTVEQDGVGERDSCIVDPCRTVGQHSEREVSALERWHSDIAERRRENDVVGDDMVCENLLERCHICGLEHGANVGESLVGGNEDGVVREVETLLIGSSQTKVNA